MAELIFLVSGLQGDMSPINPLRPYNPYDPSVRDKMLAARRAPPKPT
jgi:hypothetical protein